jgi:hypothetical protein
MTGQKNDIFSGDGENTPDTFNGKGADQEKEPARKGPAKTYDAIAYAISIDSIKNLIEDFGSRHLTREYITFAFNLCDKISITPGLDILRGQKAIWAASIVHVIARLNFLFDTSGELVLTPALICAHFKTNKSTVSNRASQIQKICGVEPGARGYCRQKIVDVASVEPPPKTTDRPTVAEEKPKNPAMRILEYRRQQEEAHRKLQARLEGREKASGTEIRIPRDDKQMKLFE